MTTGAEATVRALEALDVTTVFTVPSAHNLSILKAIHQTSEIKVIGCRHEQGVVHAADGYARTTGRIGVAIVSGGPGTANTMGGLYEAHHASSPVLLITSQIDTLFLGRSRGYVHEADQQSEMLQTACKDVRLVMHPSEVAETLIEAGLLARRGRPRPVAVQIPVNVQDDVTPAPEQSDLVAAAQRVSAPITASPKTIEEAAAVLAAAKRPLIWSGGGVVHGDASEELLAFARKWQAPVIMSREGRGGISDADPLSLGAVATTTAMREFMAECDVFFAVGSHFQHYATGEWTLPWPQRIVQLDVDPLMIGRSFTTEVSVVAEASVGLAALTEALDELTETQVDERREHLARGQQALAATREEFTARCGADHLAICQAINDLRPADSVVVRDPTVPATVWGESLMPILHPRTSVRATSSPIGPALPLAIGAAVGTGKPVIALHGDGGLMLSLGEIATAVQAKVPVVLCVFNDDGYQMLRNIEARLGDGMLHDTELVTPKFAELAETMSMPGVLVKSAAEFEVALKEALGSAGPTLIEIDLASLIPLG